MAENLAWENIATWLKAVAGSVLICVEDAEQPLRGDVAQAGICSCSPSAICELHAFASCTEGCVQLPALQHASECIYDTECFAYVDL